MHLDVWRYLRRCPRQGADCWSAWFSVFQHWFLESFANSLLKVKGNKYAWKKHVLTGFKFGARKSCCVLRHLAKETPDCILWRKCLSSRTTTNMMLHQRKLHKQAGIWSKKHFPLDCETELQKILPWKFEVDAWSLHATTEVSGIPNCGASIIVRQDHRRIMQQGD